MSAKVRKPKGRKAGAILVMMDLDEREKVREAAKREHLKLSPWARSVLLKEAKKGEKS